MLFGKTPKRGKYVKAKSPQAQKKQTAAIINYYVKKREQTKKK